MTRKEYVEDAAADSPQHAEVLEILEQTQLAAGFESRWKPAKIQMVKNKSLESDFEEKRQDFLIRGRKPEELEERWGFVIENHTAQLELICSIGFQAKDSEYNALGYNRMGVYACKHSDVCLQHALIKHSGDQVMRMLICKFIAGRPTKAIPRVASASEFIEPTQGFDSHESVIPPMSHDSLQNQFDRSQVYVYEINKLLQPSTRPRQLLPFALISFTQDGVYLPAIDAEATHAEKLATNPRLQQIIQNINSKDPAELSPSASPGSSVGAAAAASGTGLLMAVPSAAAAGNGPLSPPGMSSVDGLSGTLAAGTQQNGIHSPAASASPALELEGQGLGLLGAGAVGPEDKLGKKLVLTGSENHLACRAGMLPTAPSLPGLLTNSGLGVSGSVANSFLSPHHTAIAQQSSLLPCPVSHSAAAMMQLLGGGKQLAATSALGSGAGLVGSLQPRTSAVVSLPGSRPLTPDFTTGYMGAHSRFSPAMLSGLSAATNGLYAAAPQPSLVLPPGAGAGYLYGGQKIAAAPQAAQLYPGTGLMAAGTGLLSSAAFPQQSYFATPAPAAASGLMLAPPTLKRALAAEPYGGLADKRAKYC